MSIDGCATIDHYGQAVDVMRSFDGTLPLNDDDYADDIDEDQSHEDYEPPPITPPAEDNDAA